MVQVILVLWSTAVVTGSVIKIWLQMSLNVNASPTTLEPVQRITIALQVIFALMGIVSTISVSAMMTLIARRAIIVLGGFASLTGLSTVAIRNQTAKKDIYA